MKKNVVSIAFISIILLSSLLFSSYYSQFTRASDEDIDKLIGLIGELYGYRYFDGENPTEIKRFPIYDLEENIVSYTVLYYFGDGKLPSNEELLLLWKTKIDENLDDTKWEEILKDNNLYMNFWLGNQYIPYNIFNAHINCFYEFSPNPSGGMGFPFQITSLVKSYISLSEYLGKEIKYSDFNGFVCFINNETFCRFVVDQEEYFVNIMKGYDILTSRDELLNFIQSSDEFFEDREFDEEWNFKRLEKLIEEYKNKDDGDL